MPNDLNAYIGGAPNLQAYVDNHDGTVTDLITNLMWQQAVPATAYQPSGANAYCSALTLAGHLDWRVPSFIELVSILDYSLISYASSAPAIDETAFPSTPADAFASTTAFGASPSAFVALSFANGQSGVAGASYVRCVR
jgi:hypothetical protein